MSSKAPRPGVVPYLLSSDCEKHIKWLKSVFDGEVEELFHTPNGKVMHCGVAMNGGFVYMADVQEEGEPQGCLCHLDVEDPSIIWKKAITNGATIVTDLKVQSWGDLYGSFTDPFGFEWSVSKERSPKTGVIPYLLSPNGDCEKHIDWLKEEFGAELKEIYYADDKKVMHCSLAMNGAFVYLADGPIQSEQKRPESSRQFLCHLDVPDPKALWQKAMDNDAKTVIDLKVQSWGDLYGSFRDPFNFTWSVSEVRKPVCDADQHVKGSVIPYLLSSDCAKQVEWLKNVFDGKVKQMFHTDGKVMHCSVAINNGFVYLADSACIQSPEQKQHMAGKPQGFFCQLDVPDPDAVWKKAMANGATAVMNLQLQSWGDYYGTFKDPFGFGWGIAKGQ